MHISEEERPVLVSQPLVRIQAATGQLVSPSSLCPSRDALRSQIKLRTGILVDIEVIRSRLRRQKRTQDKCRIDQSARPSFPGNVCRKIVSGMNEDHACELRR